MKHMDMMVPDMDDSIRKTTANHTSSGDSDMSCQQFDNIVTVNLEEDLLRNLKALQREWGVASLSLTINLLLKEILKFD